jgi:hypothetical protein
VDTRHISAADTAALARRLGLGAAIVVALTGVAGCEPTPMFVVKNGTDHVLTVSDRTQEPGQPPDPPGAFDAHVTLQPGEQTTRFGLGIGAGDCYYRTVSAFDAAGKLVAQYPSPICVKKHVKTWTITAK